MDEQAELRQRFKAWGKAQREGKWPPFDPDFNELRCGAKTRAGTPCKRRDLWDSGRCRMHGGLSTGPKSGPRMKIVQPAEPEEPYDTEHNQALQGLLERQLKAMRA